MSIKKRNKDRETVIKRILKENKDELPAEKILLSAENIRRGQNVINAITGRYGPEKAIYAPTNIGDDIAYTNGRKIVVNLSHDFIANEKTLNDKRMVENAGLGVMMENCAPYMKEFADVIVKDNNNDGVAEAIEKYVLSEE